MPYFNGKHKSEQNGRDARRNNSVLLNQSRKESKLWLLLITQPRFRGFPAALAEKPWEQGWLQPVLQAFLKLIFSLALNYVVK